MDIGPYRLLNNVIAAPMAGVTDRPFRQLCRVWGAGLAVSEMIAANAELRESRKTLLRMNHESEPGPVAVQIAGSEPEEMAGAARFNVERGAQIIDINMGCPAKKVCRKQAGSALLQNEKLVAEILEAVVRSVEVPITLKIRTGTNPRNRNGVNVAKLAEASGVSAIAVHGRTRACKFHGEVEYETIAKIKQAVSIPVIANGDIGTPERAREVLRQTGADGVMIGRAAQGQPWLFKQISDYLGSGVLFEPSFQQKKATFLHHLENLYNFYGARTGVRIARKHISWYIKAETGAGARWFWDSIRDIEDHERQYEMVESFFVDNARTAALAA